MDTKVHFILRERTMSSFLVSVGLGLLLERFFEPTSTRIDDDRKVEHINIDNYKVHYFNIHTMLRNILSAISTSELKKYVIKNKDSPEALLTVLLDELETIKVLYEDKKSIPILFIPDYSEVYNKVDNSRKPELYSETNRFTKDLHDKTIKLFKKHSWNIIDVYDIKTTLPPTEGNVLITTHIAYDLLNVKNIKRLTLAESHTGVLKDKSKFNTKYHSLGSKFDKTMFPFQKELLHILGDNTLIKPYKISYRQMLAEEALNHKITPFTSEDRIKALIKKVNNNNNNN